MLYYLNTKITNQMSLLKMLSEWNMYVWIFQDKIYNTMEEIWQSKLTICFQILVATFFHLQILWTHFSNDIRFVIWNSLEEKTQAKKCRNRSICNYNNLFYNYYMYWCRIHTIFAKSIQILKIYFRIIKIILPYHMNSLK